MRGRSLLLSLATAAVLAALALVASAPAAPAAAPPPSPTLSTPPPGDRGHPLWDSYFDLDPFGYEEEEFLVSGTAVDAAGNVAAYTTRIIVTRPSDPADFNGTVLLDWVNVTAQFENAVDTMLARPMLLREGFAYVHVSAQAAGLCCMPGLTPETWDPKRYAAVDHPGDEFSFDLFTQIARAFEAPAPAPSLDPMGAIGAGAVERVLAAGQSQSGIRLFEYVNEWLPAHPEAVGVVDGFLIHGNVGQPKTYVDLPVPVLNLLSDLEAVDDDVDPAAVDPNYRLWEVAGTAHADLFIGYQSIAGHGPRVLAGAPPVDEAGYREILRVAGNYGEQPHPLLGVCIAAGATMPMRYATSTAIHELDAWAAGGAPPANGPRVEFTAEGQRALDEHGNTLGGIRLPPIDVPVARYESTLCQLGGITVPFTEAQLLDLYGDHATYFEAMAARTDEAVAAGWLLPEDAVDLMERACAAANRFPLSPAGCRTYTAPAFRQPLPTSTTPTTTSPPSTTTAAGPTTLAARPSSGATLAATGPVGPTAAWPAAALLALSAALRLVCTSRALRSSPCTPVERPSSGVRR